MALKTYNPTSPGRRALVLIDRSELHKGRPEKSLTEGLTKSGGRGAGGRIAVRFRGGGAKTLYRKIDFKRRKFATATVEARAPSWPARPVPTPSWSAATPATPRSVSARASFAWSWTAAWPRWARFRTPTT